MMQITEIESLMRQMRQHGLNRLELEDDGFRLLLERAEPTVSRPAGSMERLDERTDGSENSLPDEEEQLPGILVTSPVVGIYYAAADPDSEPFIKVGTTVEKGMTLCIIEAMKLMNEVISQYQGTVLEILVDNGQRVEYGQPLLRIGDAS